MTEELVAAVADLREEEALGIVRRLLDGGADPLGIIDDCRDAMSLVGRRFADGQAFIPELIMAGEIMAGISAMVKPRLSSQADSSSLGTVVLCTVAGDIHDIGKDIVGTMLGIAGFEVVDLGVSVPVATVVEKVREAHPQVVGLSGLLTVAFASIKATVAALDEAGLHDGLKIMIGGAPVNEAVCTHTGADGWAKDAVAAVELAKTWVGGA